MQGPGLQLFDQILQSSEWSNERKVAVNELTTKDRVWLEAEVGMEFDCSPVEVPLVVFFIQHKGVYGYRATPMQSAETPGIFRGKFLYMTPEMRSYKDRIGTHIWNRNGVRFRLKHWSLRAYNPLSPWSDQQ